MKTAGWNVNRSLAAVLGVFSVWLLAIQGQTIPVTPGTPVGMTNIIDSYGIGAPASASVTIIDNDAPIAASLVITNPESEASYIAPAIIQIQVTATDPNGAVYQVDFYANQKWIGMSQIMTLVAPRPGTPMFHSTIWTNVPAGSYVLTARAVSSRGEPVVSEEIHMVVTSVQTEPECHAIGVYSGSYNGGSSPNHQTGNAAVFVNRPGKRVTLFLSAYEPVNWHITTASDCVVGRVILSGNYAQTVTGIGAGTVVIDTFSGGSYGQVLYAGYDIDSARFYETLPKLLALTGMELSSFQGAYTAQYPNGFNVNRIQDDPRLLTSYPQPTSVSELPNLSFSLVFWSGSQGSTNGHVFSRNYTLGGPLNATTLLPEGMRAVSTAGKRYYYGVSGQSACQMDVQTGANVEMRLDAAVPELSWPMGMTYDTRRQRVMLASLGGEGFLYAYSPALDRWSWISSMNNRDVDCIQYHASEDCFYGLEVHQADGGRARLFQFATNGAFTGEIQLPVIPFGIGPSGYRSELASVGEYLVLLLAPKPAFNTAEVKEARMYLINPETKEVWLTYKQNEPLPNQPPSVTILSPSGGEIYTVGNIVWISSQASDPDGSLQSVEYFINDHSIGYGILPDEDLPDQYLKIWEFQTAGSYVITVKVTDNKSTSTVSSPVQVTVLNPVTIPTAVRQLPALYVPGVAFTVDIQITPSETTAAYAVEDRPPSGWTASAITQNGIWDPATGKVKFGPYYDGKPRLVSYNLTPSSSATGSQSFSGVISENGESALISGASTVEPGSRCHPADRSPEDNLMTVNEVTAYSSAWKNGVSWPVGPNPIPIEYATRAGALWRGGEWYTFDPVSGLPPFCWVNVQMHVPLVMVMNGVKAMARNPGSKVKCQLPGTYVPSQAQSVALMVTPRAGVLAYAVEDQPPAGWTVSSISAGGAWDAVNRRVKWFFADGQARELSYHVTAPAAANAAGFFTGTASFDDLSAPQSVVIQGMRQTVPASSPALRLSRGVRQKDESFVFTVHSAPGACLEIETSVNGTTWEPLAVITNTSGADGYTDRSTPGLALKLYRVHLAE